ncbi:hypothetical protein M3Y99_01863300 [Aphelenchoides fujianensis]|nr:hypothetical protein M3Y99_01863300 [Aphelenchoides fujianensis]
MGSRALWATSVCLLLLLAAVFFIAGTLVMTVGMNKMKEEVLKKIWLGVEANGSYTQTTLDWIDPKYEMLFKVHVFSVVNADDFRAKPNSTPMLVEKGPYTFCERQHKEVVGLAADGTRIFYRNFKWYTFDQSRSCADCFLSDVVVEVWQKVKDNFLFQLGVDAAIQKTNTTAFLKMTVGQLLFEGQSNPLLVELCKMDPTTCKDRPTIISLFRDQNGTDDGVYEVGTGINGAADISRVYFVERPDGNERVNFAERTWTSALRQWPPFLRAGPPVDIFTGRMQRIIRMEEGWPKTIEGITALSLHPSPEMNDVGVQMDEGFCNANGTRFFRDPRVQQPGCAPAGLMDISSVIDAPFLVGRPHFGGSPSAVRTAVGGVREARKRRTPAFTSRCSAEWSFGRSKCTN